MQNILLHSVIHEVFEAPLVSPSGFAQHLFIFGARRLVGGQRTGVPVVDHIEPEHADLLLRREFMPLRQAKRGADLFPGLLQRPGCGVAIPISTLIDVGRDPDDVACSRGPTSVCRFDQLLADGHGSIPVISGVERFPILPTCGQCCRSRGIATCEKDRWPGSKTGRSGRIGADQAGHSGRENIAQQSSGLPARLDPPVGGQTVVRLEVADGVHHPNRVVLRVCSIRRRRLQVAGQKESVVQQVEIVGPVPATISDRGSHRQACRERIRGSIICKCRFASMKFSRDPLRGRTTRQGDPVGNETPAALEVKQAVQGPAVLARGVAPDAGKIVQQVQGIAETINLVIVVRAVWKDTVVQCERCGCHRCDLRCRCGHSDV